MRRMLVLGSVIGVFVTSLLVREIVLATVRSTAAERHAQLVPARRARAQAAIDMLRLQLSRALMQGEQDETLRRALSSTDDNTRRRRGFEAVESVARDLGQGSLRDLGRPDFVALVDSSGRVLVRDLDPNRMRGNAISSEIPTVAEARRTGRSSFGTSVRAADSSVLFVAAEPLEGGEALVVAYQLGDGIARRMADAAGAEVALGLADRWIGTSLPAGSARDAIAGVSLADAPASVETERGELRLDVSPSNALGDRPFTMAIVAEGDASGLEASLGRILLALSFGLAGLAYVLANLLARRVLEPVAQLEDALLAVMNGQESLGVTVESEEIGGLAFRMQQVIETLRQAPSGSAKPRSRPVHSTEPFAGTVQRPTTGVILGRAELGATSA